MPDLKGAAQSPGHPGTYNAVCRLIGAALAAAILSGCASTRPVMKSEGFGPGPDLYHVGVLRVLLRPQPEVEFMCRLHALQQATTSGRILGCYVPRDRVIISIPDARVLLHEFKHFFEGSFHD